MINKRIEWSEEKSQKLQQERGFGFEDIYVAIQSGQLLDIVPHPSPEYAHQNMYVVDLNGYVVLVPFVEDNEKVFLKTAYPSRKAAKHYQKRGG